MIGVLIASKKEWKVLQEIYNLSDENLEHYPYGVYYRTNFHNKDIVFFRSGVRKINAASALQYMIDKFDFKKIINIGTCTGSKEEIDYGDVLIPDGIIDYDMVIRNVEEIKEDNIIPLYVPDISNDYITGILGTSDKSLITWEDFTYLSSFDIKASDMEAYSVVKVANTNNIECVIIKGITDKPIKSDDGFDEQLEVYEYNLPIVMKKLIEDYLTEVI